MTADMLDDRNTTVFHFSRPSAELATGKQLPADTDVRLTVRIDIEDRNFHGKRNATAVQSITSVPTLARSVKKQTGQVRRAKPVSCSARA